MITQAKIGKSMGIDEIPAEVLENESAMNTLYRLFSICFRTGIIPDDWNYSIIMPIPKSSTGDIRDPQNYRGISLALECYKIYCGILNMRLETWVTENYILHDEQNGFRKLRSTTDHLSTVMSIIETRKALKNILLFHLLTFRKVKSCVRLNGMSTDFFNVNVA